MSSLPRLLRNAQASTTLRSSLFGSKRAFRPSPTSRALQKFAMPAMSPTMTEGGIASWKKKVGESYSAGDVLLEIETDKATMDVEAQDDGILAKIIVEDGAKGVPVNQIIAITAEEGDDLSGADALAAEAEKESPSSSSSESKEPEPPKKEESAPAPEPSSSKSESSSSAPAKEESSSAPQRDSSERIFASPIAKRLAQEKGIPLGQVKGTGPNGRIIKTDVENFKAPAAAPSASKAAASPSASSSAPAPAPAASSTPCADYTDIPLSGMRRTIAGRLTQSKQELPHYYVSIDVEMDRVLRLREVFNKASEKAAKGDAAKAKEAKLSVGDFITKAASVALKEVPEVNAAWYGDFIRQHHKSDISIAVATPTGLITPIVKDVGSSGLSTISSTTKSLASKARAGKLAPHEYQGGTFTISNMGMMGISHFTAIINPPQAAILAIGGTEARLLPAEEGSEDGKEWRKANVMQATISADHRVVDGATAAKWMKAFKDALENPLSFML